MNRVLSIIILGLVSLLTTAQPRPFPPERLSDDEILNMQIRDIVYWLDFDKDTEERFVKEYSAFRGEIDGIVRTARPPHGFQSEAEIDKAIQHNFDVSERILKIRKKYYKRFKDFMKPSQIQMMYRIENEAGRRIFDTPGPSNRPPHPANLP